MLTKPNVQTYKKPVQVDFFLYYVATIFGILDTGGSFKDITHITNLGLLDQQGNFT